MVAYFAQAGLSADESGERTLVMVADLLCRGSRTAAEVARRHGVSRQGLYEAAKRARIAMAPRRPGPKPGRSRSAELEAENARLWTENASTGAELAALRVELQSAVLVDARRKRRLELACFGQHVSLRGTADLVEIAFGKEHRVRLEDLQGRMKRHGVIARGLVDEARAQVADSIRCVAADDVFFHEQDVKVMIEPESNAVLDAWHSAGSTAVHWAERLSEFPNIKLLVSDLGSDLRGAANLRGIAHQSDYFHEVRYLEDIVQELSKHEEALRRLARAGGVYARSNAADADAAEAAFYVLVQAIDQIHALFQPVNRETGRLWSPSEARSVLNRVIANLSAGGSVSTSRVARHVKTHLNRYFGHLVVLDDIEVMLRPGAGWSRDAVLNGILRRDQLARQQEDPLAWKGYRAHLDRLRLIRDLDRRLSENCANLEAVAEHLARVLARPRRSSSCVESVNSRLRVMQMTHRRVTDEMLALAALRLNLTPRKRRGSDRRKSPYRVLGVPLGQTTKRWFDVLLDAEAALALVA